MTGRRLGLVLPDLVTTVGSYRDLGALFGSAEQAGAASVWVTDHPFWHEPTVDAFSALAVAATSTDRCVIGPLVLQLPLRTPQRVVKASGFLSELAPGRVVLGVGVGEHEGEYAAAGLADRYHRRGKVLDDGIDAVRALWAGEPADPRYRIEPASEVPIWVGGRSDAARRRAARRGDGWAPHLVRAADMATIVDAFERDLAAAGRDRSTTTLAPVALVSVTEVEPDDMAGRAAMARLYGIPPHAFDRVLMRGPAAQIAEEIASMYEAGADEVTLFVAGGRDVDHFTAIHDALR